MRAGSMTLLIVSVLLGTAGRGGILSDDPSNLAGWFDVPVPGGRATLQALRIPPEDHALTLTLLARSLHGQGNSLASARATRAALAAFTASPPSVGTEDNRTESAVVPAPLSAALWRELLDLELDSHLFSTLIANRAALLFCAGATATDSSIRTLLQTDRNLTRWIYRRAPGAFVVAARSLRMVDGHIDVPGGTDAIPIWASMAGAPPARPVDFMRALLARDGGRLAWFYDTMASLSAERLAVALGDASSKHRLARARELYASFRETDPTWRLEERPFLRTTADPPAVMALLDIDAGSVGTPAWQGLWQTLFTREEIRPDEPYELAKTTTARADLSWLLHEIATAPVKERRTRFEMVRLAQRVFRDRRPADIPELVVALSHYRRFPALLLTLERMDVRSPRAFVAAVEAARRTAEGSEDERREAIATLQGALAILERARLARTLEAAAAEQLVMALANAVKGAGPVPLGVGKWIVDSLVPALPPLETPDGLTGPTAYESIILQAMAGLPGRHVSRVSWEGLQYTVDLAATERDRLHRIRARLPSPGLDSALRQQLPSLLARALLALAYTPALGDPDGPALLSPDVIERHDFGLRALSAERRAVGAWLPPRDMLGVAAPWHVQGSLLGLDLGLARLALRRVGDQEMPPVPTINPNDQVTLTRTLVALNPADLTDVDRDRLAAALSRGRRRVANAASALPALVALAREVPMSATTRELLAYMTMRLPDVAARAFGPRDWLWLGRPELAQDRLARWGVLAEPLDGRMILAMPASTPWEDYSGQPDVGRLGTQLPDLTLRLVEETARLKLPARLIPALLSFAVQDFGHDVGSRFADDWPAMMRQARGLSPTRVEDYVAALTGTGHLR